MELSISLTNYTVNYELDRVAGDMADYLREILTSELDERRLFQQSPVCRLHLHFNLYSGKKTGRLYPDSVFPENYPKAVTTRHLIRLQEFEVETSLDWGDWCPHTREKVGLPKWPTRNEVFVRLDRTARVLLAQAALELGEAEAAVAPLVGPSPVVGLDSVAKAAASVRKNRRGGKPNRDPMVPLEVTFPHEFARSELRDFLEELILKAGLGILEGWSSGPTRHEIGFVVKDAQAAVDLLRNSLKAAGYDVNLFDFEARN